MKLDIELEKAKKLIEKNNSKLVCIQLPDGIKPKAKEIQKYLEENTDAEIIIWAGSNYGACDLPLELEKLNIDLLINWGHSKYII